jgi:hypothetical protein
VYAELGKVDLHVSLIALINSHLHVCLSHHSTATVPLEMMLIKVTLALTSMVWMWCYPIVLLPQSVLCHDLKNGGRLKKSKKNEMNAMSVSVWIQN